MERITPYDRKCQVAKIAELTKRVQESRAALAAAEVAMETGTLDVFDRMTR